MMQRSCLILISLAACIVAAYGQDASLTALMEKAEFHATIESQGEGALLLESSAVEQARIQAQLPSDYGMELRPGVSDDEVRLALRIYLPDRWSKSRLQEQLTLAARSEQLRVAALQWEQVVSVYRDFCSYRLLNRQLACMAEEQQFIEPIIERADKSVEMNQMTVRDRSRIYSTYLELINDSAEMEAEKIKTQYRLKTILGPDSDLEKLSRIAVIDMPTQLEIQSLLQTALRQRADFQRMTTDYRAMQLAEEAARSEEGFRFKYLQPAYRIDYNDGETGWELSTSIILPWGTRNPDIAVYQSQQALTRRTFSEQKQLTEDRLNVLLETAEAYYAQSIQHNRQTEPLKEKLEQDLSVMADLPLDQIRDTLSIRSRLLETALLDCQSEYRMENIAIDLAEELGGW